MNADYTLKASEWPGGALGSVCVYVPAVLYGDTRSVVLVVVMQCLHTLVENWNLLALGSVTSSII